VLLLVIEAITVAKEMPKRSRESVVCLLPKKGDLSLPKDWRPISLLNTDDKVLTKLLVSRFNTFLQTIIATDRCGFVPGRQMEDAIILCQSTIHYLQQTK
jgi:Reverse transcriptase (RNA-dependent DNA polymerase)